jgi:hypothetical protein
MANDRGRPAGGRQTRQFGMAARLFVLQSRVRHELGEIVRQNPAIECLARN